MGRGWHQRWRLQTARHSPPLPAAHLQRLLVGQRGRQPQLDLLIPHLRQGAGTAGFERRTAGAARHAARGAARRAAPHPSPPGSLRLPRRCRSPPSGPQAAAPRRGCWTRSPRGQPRPSLSPPACVAPCPPCLAATLCGVEAKQSRPAHASCANPNAGAPCRPPLFRAAHHLHAEACGAAAGPPGCRRCSRRGARPRLHRRRCRAVAGPAAAGGGASPALWLGAPQPAAPQAAHHRAEGDQVGGSGNTPATTWVEQPHPIAACAGWQCFPTKVPPVTDSLCAAGPPTIR